MHCSPQGRASMANVKFLQSPKVKRETAFSAMWTGLTGYGVLQCGCMQLDQARVKNTIIIRFSKKLFDFQQRSGCDCQTLSGLTRFYSTGSFYLPAHSTLDVVSRHLAKIHLQAFASSFHH